MTKKDISTAPFDEILSCVSLSAVTDAQIANWITQNTPLSREHGFQLVQMIEFAKGDREMSAVLAEAVRRIGDLRAA